MPIVTIGSWIVVGLIIGFVASKIIKSSDDPGLGILVVAGSALVVAGVYSFFEGYAVSVFTVRVLMSAAIGAAVGAVIWHAVRSRFVSHEPQTTRRSY